MNLKDKSIALFDFSHAINVAFNALGPNEAGSVVLEWLAAVRSSASHVVLCLDSKPYKRTTIYADYKAQRKPDPELANIWGRTLQRVRDEGYQCAEAPGIEADDLMATLGREYVAALCTDVRFVTADKDISQCIGAFRRWFVPQLGKRDEFEIRDVPWMLSNWGNVEWPKREKEPKQGPTPDQIPLLLAIMGDSSDHIPGVKNIGIVQALHLIKAYKTTAAITQAATDNITAAGVEGRKPAALWENWIKGMIDVPKWLALTTLDDHVELPRPALSYLEYIEPAGCVVTEAELGAIPEEEHGDAWEPSAEELEEERRAMAASLPVEPVREPEERRAAMAAEADKVFPLPKGAAGADGQSPQAAGAAKPMVIGKDPKADEALRALARSSSTSTAPSAPQPSAPAAAAAPSSAGTSASSQSAATPPANAAANPTAAQVVSPNQGPPKPKRDADELVEPAMAAIVPIQHPTWALALQPSSAGHAYAIAKKLWTTGLYSKFHNFNELWGIILRGRELGVGMTTALDSINIIEGKPHSSAMLISALAEGDTGHEYTMMVEMSELQAIVEVKHKAAPRPSQWKYTIDQANKLGLLKPSARTGKPSQWVIRPETMLLKTAKVLGHRFQFARACLGLHAYEMNPDTLHLVGDQDP